MRNLNHVEFHMYSVMCMVAMLVNNIFGNFEFFYKSKVNGSILNLC